MDWMCFSLSALAGFPHHLLSTTISPLVFIVCSFWGCFRAPSPKIIDGFCSRGGIRLPVGLFLRFLAFIWGVFGRAVSVVVFLRGDCLLHSFLQTIAIFCSGHSTSFFIFAVFTNIFSLLLQAAYCYRRGVSFCFIFPWWRLQLVFWFTFNHVNRLYFSKVSAGCTLVLSPTCITTDKPLDLLFVGEMVAGK